MDASTENKKEDVVHSKNGTRYKRRFMKRQWEEVRKEDTESAEKKLCDKPSERIKRKKMALLMGYCGVDYYGMQRNPGVRTIEEDLMKALFEAKYITEDDFKNQQNAQFQRSSRTDKGVSAARQVVSMKLPLELNIDEVNKRLPECIKVFGVKRVTNKFNSKVKCNARTYSYTLPTYVFESSIDTEEGKKRYRISAEKLGQINEILGVYKGTKSYHNFTEKKHYQDPSASRYMMGFTVEKVFIECDMEFAVLLVKGQSFMLHQIRKMVGLLIGIMRGYAGMSLLEKVFSKDKVMVPTAPGLGLVLDMVHYDRYDTKFKDSHDSLTWEAEEPIIEEFKRGFIYPNIIRGEIEDNSIGQWLQKLMLHSYEPVDEASGEKTENEEKEPDDDDDEGDDDGAVEIEADAKSDDKTKDNLDKTEDDVVNPTSNPKSAENKTNIDPTTVEDDAKKINNTDTKGDIDKATIEAVN